MALTETIGDLIGKYSVTGVLKERLELAAERADFEARKFEIERINLSGQISDLTAHLSKATTAAKILEADRDNLRGEIAAFRNAAKPCDDLPTKCLEVLNLLFDGGGQGFEHEIYSRISCSKSEGDYFLDVLTGRDFVYIPSCIVSEFATEPPKEFHLTQQGRAYAMSKRQ